MDEFKNVLRLSPHLVEAEANLGLAYQSLYDYQNAAHYLTLALQERPTLTNLNVILGLDYLKLGAPQKAATYIRRAVELDAANVDAHDAMAVYDLTQENFQGAVEQYRIIADLDPDKAGALFRVGHEYLDLAARLAYRGARLFPDSAWGHRFLGDTLFQRGRWDDAAREFNRALAIEPKQSGLHARLGETWLHAGKHAEAQAEFRRELQLDADDEHAWLGLAELQLSEGQALEALASISAVASNAPESLKAHPEFPSVELPRQTVQACVSSLLPEPDTSAKHFLLAALLSSVDDNAGAERELQQFQRSVSHRQGAPMRSAPQTRSVPDACHLHQYSRCIAAVRKAAPMTEAAYLELGRTYFALQDYEHAADVLAQVRGSTPSASEASYWLERTYQALGAKSFAQLELSYPDSWRAHELRAEGFALRRERGAAIREYEAAIQAHPDEAELHESLGEFYLDNRSDDAAQKELEKAVALDPARAKTLYLLGRLYVLDDESEKAVPYLVRALQLQPNLDEASGLLGTAYVRMGRFVDAVPQLEKAAALDHYGNIHYQLFQAYRKLGKSDLAQKALLRSQAIRESSLEHDQALVLGSPQPEPEAK